MWPARNRHDKKRYGPLAQLAEQGTFNPKVVGSIPTGPTTLDPIVYRLGLEIFTLASWVQLPVGSPSVGVSFNGRTAGFDPAYQGSNPCTPAI